MAFDVTMTRASFGGTWPFMWRYGTGRGDPSTGFVSARSSSALAGSNFDGVGFGFLVNVTRERALYVISRLRGFATSEAFGYWGYANAEPMFDLWLFGMEPSTSHINEHYEVGIGMRAVAPVFGLVALRNQTRTVEPTLLYTLPLPLRPGRVFAGVGVKTYAGTGGFSVANTSIESTIESIRVGGWD
jgi:hypothetical protein